MPRVAPRPVFIPPVPPRRLPPNLADVGGPPPVIEPEFYYEDPLGAGPLGAVAPEVVAGPPALPEPFIPDEQTYQLLHRPQQGDLAGGPAPGGLRRALSTILPAARDLTLSAAAGANQPTFIGGLGAGIAQHEGQRARQEAQRRAELKEVTDWQKMQLDAAKTNAQIAEATARTGKARKETELLSPRQESQEKLQTAQADAARDAGVLSKQRAEHYKALIAAGVPGKEAELRAAQAALAQAQADYKREEILAGVPEAEAELKASQRARAAAEAELAEARLRNLPAQLKIDQLKADAQFNNSMAALGNARTRARAGQLTPQVVSAARNAYIAAYSRIMSQVFDEDLQKAALDELRKTHGWAMKVDPSQLGTQAPAPAGPPRTGTNNYSGKTAEDFKRDRLGK